MALFTEGKLFRKAGEGSGGGGGDQHNLGWYATESALTTAHPTAEAGDWAIVGATDTVWIWDTDNSAWVDSDQKGQVTSVNGQTGAVTVSEVPDQTGQSGKFLTTDGTNASWSDKPLVNTATNGGFTIAGTPTTVSTGFNIGPDSQANGNAAVAVGGSARASGGSVALGRGARANGISSIQINASGSTAINSDANTFKVANANGNFEIMSADGTIPTARLTKVNTTITIAVADWNGGTTVTKTVAGITSTGVVLVSPDPTDQADYTSAGIICTSQATNNLTFSCSTTPTSDIDVVVVML